MNDDATWRQDPCLHEASHAACAIALSRQVVHVEREQWHVLPGEQLGHCLAPIGERLELSQVPLCLIGYLSEGRPGWPSPWPDCLDEPLEGLGRVLTVLGVDEEDYAALVALTRDILADPDFRRLRDAIARALAAVPRLEREDIEALAAIYPISEESTCST